MRPNMNVIESLDGSTVMVRTVEPCVFCGKQAVVRAIPLQEFARWYNGGEAVQDALSMLSENDREILATGTHGQCFDGAFADPSDEPRAAPSAAVETREGEEK